MPVTDPTAATMRLDGGHPALDLVNTIYGQVSEPPEHDVLATPEDLVTFARRVGVTNAAASPSSPAALTAARRLRDALDTVLRAHLGQALPVAAPARAAGTHAAAAAARAHVATAVRDALAAAQLTPHDAAFAWTWPDDDPLAPVHRLATASLALLTDADELAHLHGCAGCCWLYLDRSRNGSRRWCSMADCGTEAKKRRYVQRRRERRSR
jgi:predicted RNA-binding Zn ribbon-like protein